MILWTVARQDPLSMGFSRQEYWIGLSCPLPDLQPTSLMSPHWHLGSFPLAPPRKYTLWINTIVTHPDEWDDNGVGSCDFRCSVTMPCLAICILSTCLHVYAHLFFWLPDFFFFTTVINGVLPTFWLAV